MMGTPLNSDRIEEFLGRLNKPLSRMPQSERAKLRLELRQHLDSLIAAHEELGSPPDEALEAALGQFGEPRQIGKKLMREWRHSHRTDPGLESVICALMSSVVTMLSLLVCAQALPPASHFFAWTLVPIAAGIVTGLVRPCRAVAGTFYGVLALVVPLLVTACVCVWTHTDAAAALGFAQFVVSFLCSLPLGCLAAYWISVRRGEAFQWTDLRLRFR